MSEHQKHMLRYLRDTWGRTHVTVVQNGASRSVAIQDLLGETS